MYGVHYTDQVHHSQDRVSVYDLLRVPGHVVLYARRWHRVHSRALTVTLTTPCNLKMLHYVSAALSIVSFFY
jgi:hypothetical protein